MVITCDNCHAVWGNIKTCVPFIPVVGVEKCFFLCWSCSRQIFDLKGTINWTSVHAAVMITIKEDFLNGSTRTNALLKSRFGKKFSKQTKCTIPFSKKISKIPIFQNYHNFSHVNLISITYIYRAYPMLCYINSNNSLERYLSFFDVLVFICRQKWGTKETWANCLSFFWESQPKNTSNLTYFSWI